MSVVTRYFTLFGICVLLPWQCLLSNLGYMDLVSFPGCKWSLLLSPFFNVVSVSTQFAMLFIGECGTAWKVGSLSLPPAIVCCLVPLVCLFPAVAAQGARFRTAFGGCMGIAFFIAGLFQSAITQLVVRVSAQHTAVPANFSNGIAIAGVMAAGVSGLTTAVAGQEVAVKSLFVLCAATLSLSLGALLDLVRKGAVGEEERPTGSPEDPLVFSMHVEADGQVTRSFAEARDCVAPLAACAGRAAAVLAAQGGGGCEPALEPEVFARPPLRHAPSAPELSRCPGSPGGEGRSPASPGPAAGRPMGRSASLPGRQMSRLIRASSAASNAVSNVSTSVVRSWSPLLAMFVVYMETFLAFPAVVIRWAPAGGWVKQETYCMIVVSAFQLFDLCGRLTCTKPSLLRFFPSGNRTWILVALRLVLPILCFLSWRVPDVGHGYFDSRVGHGLTIALHGYSQGVLTNLIFIWTSASARAPDRDVVGRALPLCLSIGIVVGSALSSASISLLG